MGETATLFSMIAYFLPAYAAMIILSVLICASLKKQKKARRVITSCFLLLPLLPYAVIAIQTGLFQAAMRLPVRQATLETGMISENAQITRIFSITSRRCVVEVIEPCSGGMCCGSASHMGQVADVLTLTRSASGWRLQDWDTVWSACGSADGNTFPPYADGF